MSLLLGLFRNLADAVLPARPSPVVDGREALGEAVHVAHPLGVENLLEGLVEEALRVLDTRDVELGGKAQLEGEAREEAGTDAVHGPNEGLGRLLREEGPSTLN